MITLFQFPAAWHLPSASPFCLKVETFLRMTKLPYQITLVADSRKAPKGKLPYIHDKGQNIPDSGLILEYLGTTYRCDLDESLPSSAKAISHAMRHMLEDHLYWTCLYSRWVDERNWPETKNAFFGVFPSGVQNIFPAIMRNQIQSYLSGQGMSLYSEDDVYHLGIQDIIAISDFLRDKDYMMGKSATSLDATAFAMLAHLIWVPIESPIKDIALSKHNLTAYCQRMKQHFFPDWRTD